MADPKDYHIALMGSEVSTLHAALLIAIDQYELARRQLKHYPKGVNTLDAEIEKCQVLITLLLRYRNGD